MFYIQKPDILQIARQFPLHFYIKKPDTLHYMIFHEHFEVGICIQKT